MKTKYIWIQMKVDKEAVNQEEDCCPECIYETMPRTCKDCMSCNLGEYWVRMEGDD